MHPVESRSEAVRLGRYGIRCPLVLDRLGWDETSGEVLYRARPGYHDGRGESVARWDVLEFLARVLDHVPDPGQQLVRYWGFYSNAARGRRERRTDASRTVSSVVDPSDAESRQRRLTWSHPIRKVYEIDPLLCPFCGSQLTIVAFLVDRVSLRRLLTQLGFAPQRPEPLAHAPPTSTSEFTPDSLQHPPGPLGVCPSPVRKARAAAVSLPPPGLHPQQCAQEAHPAHPRCALPSRHRPQASPRRTCYSCARKQFPTAGLVGTVGLNRHAKRGGLR